MTNTQISPRSLADEDRDTIEAVLDNAMQGDITSCIAVLALAATSRSTSTVEIDGGEDEIELDCDDLAECIDQLIGWYSDAHLSGADLVEIAVRGAD